MRPTTLSRQIFHVMQVLNRTRLFASYSATGTPQLRPDLMLRVVLIEMQQGRYRPSQWLRDVREHTPLISAAFGIRPLYSVQLVYDLASALMLGYDVCAQLTDKAKTLYKLRRQTVELGFADFKVLPTMSHW